MKQEYQNYTRTDFKVWQTLFERQFVNLQDKACQEYLACLKELSPVLYAQKIPRFEALNELLKAKNGWQIEVVPGLISAADFFQKLAQRKFCSSTWLRKESQLDYLEEPDMFHDIFGHIPLLMDKDYAAFAQRLGEIGRKYVQDEEIVVQLQRLYWFTIEFGLMRAKSEGEEVKIYGAGIISSYGETNHIYDYKSVMEVLPFELDRVIQQDFDISHIQTLYFEINSFNQLYHTINQLDSVAC